MNYKIIGCGTLAVSRWIKVSIIVILFIFFLNSLSSATSITLHYYLDDIVVWGEPIDFDAMHDEINIEITFVDGDDDGWLDVFNPVDKISMVTQFDIFDLNDSILMADKLIKFDDSISLSNNNSTYFWEGLSISPLIRNCISLHISSESLLAYVPDSNSDDPLYTISGNLVQAVPELPTLWLFMFGLFWYLAWQKGLSLVNHP